MPIARQPAVRLQVSRAHPLARGLVGFWYPAGGRFLSAIPSNADAAPVNGVQRAGSKGNNFGVTSAGQAASIAYNPRLTPSAALTVLMEGVTNSAVNSYLISGGYDEITENGWGMYRLSGTQRIFISQVGGVNVDVDLGIASGASAALGFVFDGATTWAVANGAKGSSQAQSGAITLSTNALTLTSKTDGGAAGTGQFNYLGIWSRALDSAELRAFYLNPWQILAPERNRLFSLSGTGAAGSTYTGSIAESGSAADTPGGTLALGGAASESGTASDAPGGALVLTASASESGSASASQGGGLALGGGASEAGSAADTPAAALVLGGAIAETGSAADTVGGAPQQAGSASESGSAADSVGGALALGGAASEAGSAADAPGAAIVLAAGLAEAGAAAEALGGGLALTGAVAEAGSLADLVGAGGVVVVTPLLVDGTDALSGRLDAADAPRGLVAGTDARVGTITTGEWPTR